jgi:hypothetical protein
MADLLRCKGSESDLTKLVERQRELSAREDRKAAKGGGLAQLPRVKRGEPFICGPIPLKWTQQALSIGGKAGNVALALWWLVGLKKTTKVRLTAQVLGKFRVSPRSARRLVDQFERAGLVRVDRKRGRGPDVTLLDSQSHRAE